MRKQKQITDDFTGRFFGHWEVIGFVGLDKNNRRRWLCRCKCGVEREVITDSLRRGSSRSCGCTIGEHKVRRSHLGMTGTPQHNTWLAMRQRCRDPNHISWAGYGGRGIRVFDEWNNSFEAFWRDMGPNWKPGLTVERIDVNGHYEPGNCIWVPMSEQSKNRRPVSEWKAKPSGRPKRQTESAAHGAS